MLMDTNLKNDAFQGLLRQVEKRNLTYANACLESEEPEIGRSARQGNETARSSMV